jgi:hypothetical protein
VVIHCRVPAALLGRIPDAEAVVREHARPEIAAAAPPADEPDPAPR